MEQGGAGAAPGAAEIKSVFVGKLPESATEEKLQALFSGFGEIEKVTGPMRRQLFCSHRKQ